MNTYPEMNKQIVALLKASGTTVDLYAAARIEELEKELKELAMNDGSGGKNTDPGTCFMHTTNPL